MTTPFNQIQPAQFVTNTDFETEIDKLENCGAHMTTNPSTGNTTFTFFKASNPRTRCVFQNNSNVQIVSYGKNPPTEHVRSSSSGGGTGFKINKDGYYEIYGQYRGPSFTNWEHQIVIQVDDEGDNIISTELADNKRTTTEKWPANVRDGSAGEKISRIQGTMACGISLNKGDNVYLCVDPVVSNGTVYEFSLYFNVKYIGPVGTFSS